jgi:hypothetical protein
MQGFSGIVGELCAIPRAARVVATALWAVGRAPKERRASRRRASVPAKRHFSRRANLANTPPLHLDWAAPRRAGFGAGTDAAPWLGRSRGQTVHRAVDTTRNRRAGQSFGTYDTDLHGFFSEGWRNLRSPGRAGASPVHASRPSSAAYSA